VVTLSTMDEQDIVDIREKWNALSGKLEATYGEAPDLQAIIFLIGVQELGQGYQSFSKDQKQDLMHIATCKLLSYWGYYELSGTDEDGWPHWNLLEPLPPLTLKEQDLLLRRSVIQYFTEQGQII
jgi:hypothetical protein